MFDITSVLCSDSMFGVTSVSTMFRGNVFTAHSALCSEVGCHFCAMFSGHMFDLCSDVECRVTLRTSFKVRL